MNSLKDLLNNKANEIDDSGVKTDLDMIQSELDRYFTGGIIISRIKDGVATVVTSNASLASNMRMQSSQLVEDLNSSLKNKLERFVIRIR